MKAEDLKNLSSEDLQNLKTHIESHLNTRRSGEIREAYRQAEALARGVGLSLADLVEQGTSRRGRKTTGSGNKVEPRYRNPENDTETWTGRGKKPRWLAARIAEGSALEDFLINDK